MKLRSSNVLMLPFGPAPIGELRDGHGRLHHHVYGQQHSRRPALLLVLVVAVSLAGTLAIAAPLLFR